VLLNLGKLKEVKDVNYLKEAWVWEDLQFNRNAEEHGAVICKCYRVAFSSPQLREGGCSDMVARSKLLTAVEVGGMLALKEGGSARTQPKPPTDRVAEEEESGLSLKSVTDKGGAADVPSRNVPRWLQEVMSRDETTVLSEAMHQNHVHESDLKFIDNDTLKKAGIVNGFSRAKILSRIKILFKQENE
jgi:hypothetical protein